MHSHVLAVGKVRVAHQRLKRLSTRLTLMITGHRLKTGHISPLMAHCQPRFMERSRRAGPSCQETGRGGDQYGHGSDRAATESATSFWQLHRNVKVRLAISFVQRFFNMMVVPFMIIYLATHFSAGMAGLLMLVAVGIGVLASLYGGHLSDLHGRRRMLLLGELSSVATFGLMAVADSPWWNSAIAVYLLFLFNNTLSTMALPAHDAMIVDVTSPDDRKLAYTVSYWSFNLALASGSVLGGFLYERYFAQVLAAAAVCMLAVGLVTYFFVPETAPPSAEDKHAGVFTLHSIVRGYAPALRDPLFLRLLAAATLGMSIDLQFLNYIGVRLATQFPTQAVATLGPWQPMIDGIQIFSILRAENTILVVGLALLVTPLLRRFSDAEQISVGILFYTLGFMVLAVSNHAAVLLLAMVVVTAGEMMNVPVKQALLANLVPAQARTRYMAVYNLNVRFGLMVAAACITLGSIVPSWCMAVLYALFGLLTALLYRSLFRASATPSPVKRRPDRTAFTAKKVQES